MIQTFSDFNFNKGLMEGLDAMGFQKPTPIQQEAIPHILNHSDMIACAQTGTGKTAAFLLPIIHKIITDPGDYIHTLIIVPTRELAIQIDEAFQGFAYFTNVTATAIYGGADGNSFEQEKKALTQGTNIIIATPGRLLSHLNQKYVKFEKVQHLILDEADRMLDMGFSDDLNKIFSFLPAQKQTLLFSATMPAKIREMAKRLLKNPIQINIAISKPAEGVTQGAFVVYNDQKLPLLNTILKEQNHKSMLIFSSTKIKVKELERELKHQGFNASAIHSDLEQEQRNEVLRNFKNRDLQTLVATDILSRGIDIDSIGLVINFDVPGDAEDYVHRIGRTARAETTGLAYTFINPEDQIKFKRIEDMIGAEVNKLKVPESLGDTPMYQPQERKNRKPFRKNFKNKSVGKR